MKEKVNEATQQYTPPRSILAIEETIFLFAITTTVEDK